MHGQKKKHKNQLLHVSGPTVLSSGSTQLHKTELSAFLLHAGNENIKPVFLYNCLLPDDGPIRLETCRN